MRTFAWIAGCFLFGCSGTPVTSRSDAGADPDGGSVSLVYSQSFAGRDGDDWPAPWQPIGGHIPVHDIQNNQGRFRSDATGPYPLGRMMLPNFRERNVDVTWTVTFEDPTNQGSGFYVRQNGQYIGDGYALFLDGFFTATHLAFWSAVNGAERVIYSAATATPSPFSSNTPYRMRFQVVQIDNSNTRLRGKLWLAAQAEPDAWQMEYVDSTAASLQNVDGSFAFDVYNRAGTGNVFVSDLRIVRP